MLRSAVSLLVLVALVSACTKKEEAPAPAPVDPTVAPSPEGTPAPGAIPTPGAQPIIPANPADPSKPTGANEAANGAPMAKIEPYRTFLTIMRYTMENNGEPTNPISNVRIGLEFPSGNKLGLPEAGQYWPIGNGQMQEINRTYEIPWAFINNDGFKFKIQMERKGSLMLPCEFDIVQLSQFNRTYTCHTDLKWQQDQRVAESNLDKEGIQIRIFTSKNSLPKEIPQDALALK